MSDLRSLFRRLCLCMSVKICQWVFIFSIPNPRSGTFVVVRMQDFSRLGSWSPNPQACANLAYRVANFLQNYRQLYPVYVQGETTVMHRYHSNVIKYNFNRFVFLDSQSILLGLVPCTLILQNYVTLKVTHRVALETPVLRLLGVPAFRDALLLCNAVACPHLERSGMGTACSRSASAHLYHAGSRLLPCDGAAD